MGFRCTLSHSDLNSAPLALFGMESKAPRHSHHAMPSRRLCIRIKLVGGRPLEDDPVDQSEVLVVQCQLPELPVGFSHPKTSSTSFRPRWLTAKPAWRVVRP